MKKYIFLLSLFWAISTIASAQSITRLEYSIDGFVAEGKGTALEIPGNTSELDTDFNIDVSGLEPGNHTIHFRAKNENGVWSFAAERSFYIPETPVTEGIVAMEYSIDEIRKEGKGNLITLQYGTNHLDSTLVFDVSGLEPGIHSIYMRAKNKLGVWSLPAERTFVIVEPDTAKIKEIHYRIYNEEYESVWMTAALDPARQVVDSTIRISTAGLDFDKSYSIEFYAKNSKNDRSFSAYLSNLSLMMNHAPERLKENLEIVMSVNQHVEISMDSMFNDADLIVGDSLAFHITNTDNAKLQDFSTWASASILALSPIVGNSGEYNFWLKTIDLAGESDSVMVKLTVTGATGIESKAWDERFTVSPNPTSNYITISVEGNNAISSYYVKLYNTTGQLLQTEKVYRNHHRLSLKGLNKGLYFVVMYNSNFMVRKKIVYE